MITALLDPFIFSCPAEATEDDVIDLVNSLLQWRDVTTNHWLRKFVSLHTTKCLLDAGCGFPPWQALSQAIERLGIELQPKDVFEVIKGLLDRLPKLEEDLGVDDILLDEVQCDPSPHANRVEVFRTAFERIVAFVCLFTERDDSETSQYVIFSRILGGSPTRISFAAQLLDVSPPVVGPFPRPIQCTTTAYDSADSFTEQVDPTIIWADASSDVDYRAAIEIHSRRIAQISGVDYSTSWRLGPRFASTVEALNLKHRQMAQLILNSCAETILGQTMRSTHKIRSTSSPNSPQLHRNRDTAWRRDVDHEIHLHYWSTTDGPEFACVVMHNDFSIPID